MATKIQGLDRLKRKLQAFPDAARDEIIKAMEQSAAEVVAMAKSLVPVDSGGLRDSIGWTWGDPPKGAISIASAKGLRRQGSMFITIYAGNSEAYQARWVEFGTSAHVNGGKFAGSQHPGTAAQPFFFPAFRALRKRIKSRLTRAINKAAKRVASGG